MSTLPQLFVRTVELPLPFTLPDLLGSAPSQLAWIRNGQGFVGYGQTLQWRGSGAHRFQEAADWWRALLDRAMVTDPVHLPGTGLICAGSFSFFADSAAGSTLIVPQLVLGTDGERAWATSISQNAADGDFAPATAPIPAAVRQLLAKFGLTSAVQGAANTPTSVATADEATPARAVSVHCPLGPADYAELLRSLIARITAGEASKVVFARHLQLTSELPITPGQLVARLTAHYPQCWTFAVDGLVGATPEMLADDRDGKVCCRVLAGTTRLTDPEAAAAALFGSPKDLAEHRLSVDSAVAALRPLGSVCAGETFVTHLPNLSHLATDIETELAVNTTALEVAGALHPTAALGGTPREAALQIIKDLEGDRDRYGAPVGWLGANCGQWAVALRCARLESPNLAHAWAGGGILADSDIATEYAETDAKFTPILGAFGVR